MDQFAASGRFSREEEADEEQEDASNSNSMREISFMPASAAGTTTASSSAAASASAASTSAASASAASGSSSAAAAAFRSASGDAAGASGSGGGGGAAAEVEAVEKEHMFDKVVTPSDVGKLNRLVIPKQYAEKYFPLDSAAGSEKGLLLGFEDGAGKHWRFRYSYWNSSQSYVMTKGWSRFVKEKRLLAGDTVSFSRAAAEESRHRLFIDWKRRVDARGPLRFSGLALPMPLGSHYGVGVGVGPHHYSYSPAAWGFGGVGGGGAAGGFFMPPSPPATLYEHRLRQGLDFRSMTSSTTYPASTVGRQLLFFGSAARMPPHQHHHAPPHPQPPRPLSLPLPLHHFTVHQPSAAAGVAVAASSRPVVLDSVPVIESPTTAAKRVRLFGVNLDNNNPLSESSDGGGGGGGEASHQQGNALSLQMPGWQQRTHPTLRLLELPRHGAESSAASSPSSSSSSKREARSALDLDL